MPHRKKTSPFCAEMWNERRLGELAWFGELLWTKTKATAHVGAVAFVLLFRKALLEKRCLGSGGVDGVGSGAEGVTDAATQQRQNGDDHKSHQRDQKTILDQCLALFFTDETVQHFLNSPPLFDVSRIFESNLRSADGFTKFPTMLPPVGNSLSASALLSLYLSNLLPYSTVYSNFSSEGASRSRDFPA